MLSRIDAMVEGTRFVPPTDLADARAAIKLMVTAACGAEATGVGMTEQQPWFYVDCSSVHVSSDCVASTSPVMAGSIGGDTCASSKLRDENAKTGVLGASQRVHEDGSSIGAAA